MRPDNLVVYAVLQEAKRLSKTREYRKFRPGPLAAVRRLMANIPEPVVVNVALRQLVNIYRSQLNLDDVKVACGELGLADQADAIAEAMRPHLWQLFDGLLQWHDNGDVHAVIGDTVMETLAHEVPLQDGKLHGIISYGDEKYEFYQGFLLPPESLTPEIVERYYDNEPMHRAFVGLIGIDVYLAYTTRAQSWKEDGLEYIFTERFALVRSGSRTLSAPTRMFHMEDVKRWYAAVTENL